MRVRRSTCEHGGLIAGLIRDGAIVTEYLGRLPRLEVSPQPDHLRAEPGGGGRRRGATGGALVTAARAVGAGTRGVCSPG